MHAEQVSAWALAASEPAFETLFKDAPVGFAFFAPDLRYQRVNQMLAGANGKPAYEHIGRLPSEVLPSLEAAVYEAALLEVLHELQPVQKFVSKESDGPTREWSLSWFPARGMDGELAGVTLIAVDVTNRQSTEDSEEEVRRTAEWYRSAMKDSSSAIVWMAEPDGEVCEDSPEWRAITGQEPEEYLGFGWLDSVHPEDRERTETAWREAVRNKGVFDTSYRVRTRSGSYRHFDSRAVPIVRQGEVVEWVGAHTDVTSAREADEVRHRLTQQLGEAALRTARLQQATSMLAEALTVEQVVQVITEVARRSVGADRLTVALLDRVRLQLNVVNDGGVLNEIGVERGGLPLARESVMTVAVRERKPFIAENPESLRAQLEPSAKVDAFLERTDERAWVGLPLLAAGAPLGALRFAFTRPREISEEEKVFLKLLGGQCALAVERATLFEREHKTAEALQRSLLPDRLPKVDGMLLAAKYSPGARNVQIGGDWYDAFPLPDGQLAAVLGDVMGKGVKAAAGMSRVSNALRALAYSDPRPAAVLAGLDRMFSYAERDDQVTTLAYLAIDPVSGDGFMVNAGHPPPILLAQDAPPRLLTTEPATPLGWPSPRRQHAIKIPPGHTVVLYSDGLVENRRRGLDSGLDELLTVAGQAPPEVVSDPGMLLEYLADRTLAGYDQDDDVTLLAVHMVSEPATSGAKLLGTGSIPITIYLSEASGHDRVEATLVELLHRAGIEIDARDKPILGSWFRRMYGRLRVVANTPAGQHIAGTAAHAVETRLVHAQDAEVTARLLENLAPLIESIRERRSVVIRVGAVLVVQLEGALSVHQLTPIQQLKLDRNPELVSAPDEILAALALTTAEPSQLPGASPPALEGPPPSPFG